MTTEFQEPCSTSWLYDERQGLLSGEPWKIEHGEDGLSFLAFPWSRDGQIEEAWLGPMDRHVAEWLFDAVQQKQTTAVRERGP